jgi:RHS repeat-associated protein
MIYFLWAALAMLAWLVLAAPANAQCSTPAPGGNPNGNGCPGVASLPAGGANSGAGNPINVMTGNKYQREDDLPALPGVLGLEIVRHYNSAYSAPGHPNGVLGRGWRLSYETELVDRFGKLQVLQADGGRVIFDRDRNSPTGCSTRNPDNGSMTLGRQNGRPDYTWTWTDGRKLHFNYAGKLDRITAPSGEVVRLLYDDQNVLVRVIDPQGRNLNLVYYDRHIPNQFHGVQFIDTPVGRFAYEYGSAMPKGAGLVDQRELLANLVRVRLPDHFDPATKAHALSSRGTTRSTTSRIYHHEDPRSPWLMTGISIESPGADSKPVSTRYATYGYDGTGRAILSTHAGNVDKVTLDNHEAGRIVLTNSLGQKTVYRYTVIGDTYRLLEVRGAGCSLCGEPNVRYGYDDVGRRTKTTKLSEDGKPLVTERTDRDMLGRVTRISKIPYKHGMPEAAQLQMRFEYRSNSFAPALVVRPSVVSGKELVTRIDYNAAGQPLRVSETGWSPITNGKQVAAQIDRTFRFYYTTLKGRSLLTEIDGPLPNGKTNSPADSDVTIFEYDHRSAPSMGASSGGLARYERRDGLLTRVIAPGNLVTEVLERDAALRPTRVRMTNGDLLQEISVASNWRGAPLHLELAADALRRTMDYEYTSFGQLAAVTMPGNRRIAISYDSAAPRTPTVLPDGGSLRNEQALQLAALNHEVSIVAARLEPAAAEAMVSTADTGKRADSAEPIQMRTGVPGSTSEHIVEELSRDGHGENAVLARRWLDDFGRLVAVQYADQGVTSATYYGGSERVATLTNAAGVVTQLDYNAHGQLAMLERKGRDGKVAERIQYEYQGGWLVTVAKYSGTSNVEPESRIRFVRNAFGQITQELQAGDTASSCVNHAYDEAGRLVQTWLTEYCGTAQALDLPVVSMRHASDARLVGQVDSIRVGDAWFGQRIVVSALRWLLPSPPVATAWRFGNGLQAQAQYEARKEQHARLTWRLRAFNDGVHPYTISSDDSGHIDAASQQEHETLAGNNSRSLISEAQAAPAPPEALTSSGTIAVASADTDANKFDAAGRMRSYRSWQGKLDLTWDSAGQLIQVSRDGKRVASYAYDGQGRRISKTVEAEPSAKRIFIYSGEQLIAEAAADGTILKQYIYLGWRPVAWIEPAHTLLQRLKQYLFGPKIVYLHTDHRGAVTAATGGDKRILWNSNVDAFGNLHSTRNEPPGIEQPLRLAGQYADRETGLYYNLARYYNPRSGNFLSPDPAGLGSGSLDLYAYAAGDPLNYFDPDGWAKVVYYAITSKADGKTALGTNQGFTKARWAFVISDIKDGVKQNVIYDPTGGFVKSSFSTAKGDAFAWNAGEAAAGDPTSLMQLYYGDSLISLSEFTINNFDDAQARAILEKLGYAGQKPSCPQAVLPQISFGPGDAAIDVTNLTANGADRQRILNCALDQASSMPMKYADDTERNRVEKYEAAAEMNETASLGKDCSNSGCPGVDITGQSGIVYHASYGRSQFTGDTFLATINRLSTEAKEALGVTADMQDRITKALARALEVGRAAPPANPGAFTKYRARYNCSNAASAWDNAGQTAQTPRPMTIAEKSAFQANTGLGRQAFIDMVCFAPSGNARPLGEGRNAFMTEAIFTDTTLKNWIMGIFKSDAKFGYISRTLLREDLKKVLGQASLSSHFVNAEAPTTSDGAANPSYQIKQRSIEEELAMRVARLHNGGKNIALSPNTATLTSNDTGNYVKKFIGIINDGHGDWRSLRCAADIKSAGTNGTSKWRGLEFKALKLPTN